MPQIVTQPDDVEDDDRHLTERRSATWLGYGWPLWTKERDKIPYIQVGKFRRYTKRILKRYQASRIVKPTARTDQADSARP